MTANLRAAYAPLLALAGVVGLLAAFLGASPAWSLIWVGLLLPLLVLVARWSPVHPGAVAASLGVAAVAVWPVPLMWGTASWLEICGAVAFWAAPALGALAAGGICAVRRAGCARPSGTAGATSSWNLPGICTTSWRTT